MKTEEKLPNFQGKIIKETKIINPDLTYKIDLLKKEVKKSAAYLPQCLKEISQLLPNVTGNSLEERQYYEIKLSDLDFENPIVINQESLNLCIVFKSCKFKRLLQNSFGPIVFENCEIEELSITPGAQNVHAFGCKIGSVSKNKSPNTEICFLTFHNCSIHDFNIADCKWSNFYFKNDKIERVVGSKSILKKVKFESVEFISAPDFTNAEFDKSVVFLSSKFHDLSLDAPIYYRELRMLTHKNNDEEMANLFGALEIKSRYYNQKIKDNPLDKFVGFSYQLINDFGINIFKPLKLIIGLFFLSFLTFIFNFNDLIQLKYFIWLELDLLSPLKYSFLSCLGPLRLFSKFDQTPLNSFQFEFIFWIFSLVSSILWYFIIIGVRKRYKLSH